MERTEHASSSSSSALPQRCRHKTQSGNPCRYFAAPNSIHCKRHARVLPPVPDEFVNQLAYAAGNFDDPDDVKRVLTKIFHALAAGLITERRAGVLCYLAQTILHAHRAADYRQKLAAQTAAVDAEAGEQQEDELPLTWNLPRSPEALAAMAERNPKQALAIIRAQAEERLARQQREQATSTESAFQHDHRERF